MQRRQRRDLLLLDVMSIADAVLLLIVWDSWTHTTSIWWSTLLWAWLRHLTCLKVSFLFPLFSQGLGLPIWCRTHPAWQPTRSAYPSQSGGFSLPFSCCCFALRERFQTKNRGLLLGTSSPKRLATSNVLSEEACYFQRPLAKVPNLYFRESLDYSVHFKSYMYAQSSSCAMKFIHTVKSWVLVALHIQVF